MDAIDTSAFSFATDLADEGVEPVLDNLQRRAGIGGVTPAFVYHAARDVFPHNPRRKVHVLDRGAHFFPPDAALYDGLRIQPRVDPLVLERDVLAETCRAAAARGMRVHAWTVFLHPDRPDEYPECATVNAFGDRYPADLCPANDDVRAYVRALVADVARYEVETILAESLHFHAFEHGYHHERYFIELGALPRFLLGLCFCASCAARAEQTGVDADAVRAAARAEVERSFASRADAGHAELDPRALERFAGGELARYLAVRAQTVTTLAADAAEIAAGLGRRLVFLDTAGAVKGYTTGKPTGGAAAELSWRLGIDLAELGAVCHGFEVLGYAADPRRVRLDVAAYRDRLGQSPVGVALRPSPPDCESSENLVAKLAAAKDSGAERVDFYHYGFVRLEALDMIRRALEA